MKIFDQHVHSYYSFDSDQKIEPYLSRARELGLKYFILTDHYDFNYLDKNKDTSFDIEGRTKELEKLQNDFSDIKILNGIEVGYKKDSELRIKEIINKYHFDLINLSVHDHNGVDYYFKEEFINQGIDKILTDYYSAQLEMVKSFDDYDVLCHIDFGFKTAYLIDNSLSINKYEDYLTKIMKEVIKKDKALELNVKVQRFLPIEHTKYILDLYKKLGGKNITISSDAHEVKMFCYNFDKYISIIKEMGFDHLCYFINRKRYNLDI